MPKQPKSVEPSTDVLQAAMCTALLREDLNRLRRTGLTDQQLASALAYELAAVIGKNAPTLEQAETLLRFYMATMVSQIATFGVGKVHP